MNVLERDEVERYARHIVLPEIGGAGQQKLKAARVLLIGAGGLGSPLLQYLAAAGIGTIGIVDDDVVSLSNLQRQVLHGTADVGRSKTDSAYDAAARINPHVTIIRHHMRANARNIAALVRDYDVVADGSDNFETRYLVSDACCIEQRPLVTAAVGAFDASLTTLLPFEKNASGALNPTYRCLFPEPPPAGSVPACAEAGVLGALTGIAGSLMALEVVREIVGFGQGLVGRLLLFDARMMRFEMLGYAWDSDNPLTGSSVTVPR